MNIGDQDKRARTYLISRKHRLVKILWRRTRGHEKDREREEKAHLGVDIRDLLNGTTLARSTMFRGDDAAVRTLAKFFDELIFRINDECGVERGEGVTLHVR